MRLVFISSVTAMTPLRTISVITGSSGRRLVRFIAIRVVVFRAIAHSFSARPIGAACPLDGFRLAQAIRRGLSSLTALWPSQAFRQSASHDPFEVVGRKKIQLLGEMRHHLAIAA